MIGPFGAEIDFLMQELAAGLVASGRWGGLSNFFPIGFLIALSCFPSRQASLQKRKESVITCNIVEKEYLIFFWNKQLRGQRPVKQKSSLISWEVPRCLNLPQKSYRNKSLNFEEKSS